MSQLDQLKQTINGIASSTKKIGQSLSGFKSQFAQQVSQTQAAIGGSAKGADKKFMATLEEAKRQVDAAVAALEKAAKEAVSYGQSL